MWLDLYCGIIGRRPGIVLGSSVILALGVVLTAPDLTRLVASKPARLLPEDAESRGAIALTNATWPDQAAVSVVVVALRRADGLTGADGDYARRLAGRFNKADRPAAILGAIGPGMLPGADDRFISRDGRVQLVIVRLSESFVGPAITGVLDWLDTKVKESPLPNGLVVTWSGDAVLGDAFMGAIRATLDRAAAATVVLILVVLLLVYRSVWLAMVPLLTIGLSLAITRGVLGWLVQAGWEVSILAELFLVVILFGSGTDFCLLLTWRFAEHWDGGDPALAMAATWRRIGEPLLTSAGTVIVGLALMGTTRFALFSRTGPAVALGLALTLIACFTLTPALLVTLARYRPKAFAGLKKKSLGIWPAVGRTVLSWPKWVGSAVVVVMMVPATFGLRTSIVHDLLAILPKGSAAVRDFHQLSESFGAGAIAPLTVVLESPDDLHRPAGIALIDELSRELADRRGISKVRSAARPTGDPAQLDPARMGSRLDKIQEGLGQISRGNDELLDRLNRGAAKLRLAQGFGRLIGKDKAAGKGLSPVEMMSSELAEGVVSARRLADGSRAANDALAAILDDPGGRDALGRLLITPADLEAHPELRQGLAYYISPDGHRARIELEPDAPMFSTGAIETVEDVRRVLAATLKTKGRERVRALVGGTNADWADVRTQTRADQRRIWWLVPLGVGVILLLALRDLLAALNLIATMLLTYLFALGATHLFFVVGLGAPGVDWTVPYFLFILLVAVGVDYNVFLMARLREESRAHGLRSGIERAVGHTGGLISSAAAITACSFAAFLFSPLGSLRQLGFALVVGIVVDALLVRPVLVPCGHWLLHRSRTPKLADSEGDRCAPRPGVRRRVLAEAKNDLR